MSHRGDFDLSAVIYGKFTTYRPSTGAAYTLAGTPALSVYKDNSATQSTTGVTLTADFDSVTGLNHFAIDTSADGTFYSAGSFFDIVITTGTVDSVSVVGSVVGSFTLRKDSSLKPTTAGRTLDVTATGAAGIDWANVESPTTAVDLSGTNIKTNQKVDVETIKTQAVTCGAGVTVLASVGTAATSTAQTGDSYALANGANGFAAIKSETAAIVADTNELQTDWIDGGRLDLILDARSSQTSVDDLPTNAELATALGTADDAVLAQVALVKAVTDKVDTSLVLDGAVYQFTANALELAPTGGSAPSASTIADAVWDEALSGHLTTGTTGEALNTSTDAHGLDMA